MIMGIIYCLTSPSKKKYVGQTERELGKRIKEHCTSTGCIALYAAIQNIWNWKFYNRNFNWMWW